MSSSSTAYAPKLFGERLADRYLVGEVIGGGGFAWVYRGTDTLLERDVALKVLKPREGNVYPEELQQRFIQEAKMTARLTSPYTVTLYDYGSHAIEDGTEYLYMACEFVDGVTLGQHVETHGTLKPLECADVIHQVLQSLQEAHQSGFVHRDIKSANIMMYKDASGRQSIKVLDYGIGKALTPEWDAKLTQTGSINGTPAYASPEQLRSEPIQPATDLYSLGIVGYECLTGGHPYEGRSTTNVLVEVVMGPDIELPSPLDQGPLAPIIHKMLKKDQDARYESCRQVLEDLKWLETREDRLAREDSEPELSPPPQRLAQTPRLEAAIAPASISAEPPIPEASSSALVSLPTADQSLASGAWEQPASNIAGVPTKYVALFGVIVATLVVAIVLVWSQPPTLENNTENTAEVAAQDTSTPTAPKTIVAPHSNNTTTPATKPVTLLENNTLKVAASETSNTLKETPADPPTKTAQKTKPPRKLKRRTKRQPSKSTAKMINAINEAKPTEKKPAPEKPNVQKDPKPVAEKPAPAVKQPAAITKPKPPEPKKPKDKTRIFGVE